MPLADPPPAAGSLAHLPDVRTADRRWYRIWRRTAADGTERPQPWWFASRPDSPEDGGRYDLPAPQGTCYTATSRIGAVLEALQMHLTLLPRAELAIRQLATIATPHDSPPAADLTARAAAGVGITAAVWAGSDRARTQAWADALRRDGWWVVHSGLQHDPSGTLRGHALFDHAGAHPPSYGRHWPAQTASLHDDGDLHDELADYGIAVHDPADLPWADPP